MAGSGRNIVCVDSARPAATRRSARCGVAAGALLVVLLAACAGSTTPTVIDLQMGQRGELAGRLWPAPPEVPRYRYVGELLGEQNVRLADGGTPRHGSAFWRWLTGIGEMRGSLDVLQRPISGVADAQGRIYVTDVSRRAVFVFDVVAGALHLWEFADAQQRFVAPVGIAVDGNGRLLVTDAELGGVFRFDADGTFRDAFGMGILQRPTGIAYDPSNRWIYVADTEADNIKVFEEDGRLLDTLGFSGDGPGRLNHPVYLTFAQGRLYVTDTLNARVQVFDRDGNRTSVIGQRGLYVGNFTRPKGVALDGEGHIYVVEGFYDHLLVFAPDGDFLMSIGGTGQQAGNFYLPAGVWTDSSNRIFVADMFNGRVSVFQFLGAEQ